MKKYELRYLPLFFDDLAEKTDYIRYRLMNPEAADNLLDAVEEAILKRLENPESFEPYESERERKYTYYRIYVQKFIVYYVVIPGKPPVMEVRRFLYKGQDRDNIV